MSQAYVALGEDLFFKGDLAAHHGQDRGSLVDGGGLAGQDVAVADREVRVIAGQEQAFHAFLKLGESGAGGITVDRRLRIQSFFGEEAACREPVWRLPGDSAVQAGEGVAVSPDRS